MHQLIRICDSSHFHLKIGCDLASLLQEHWLSRHQEGVQEIVQDGYESEIGSTSKLCGEYPQKE
jgi:hypothetical protein